MSLYEIAEIFSQEDECHKTILVRVNELEQKEPIDARLLTQEAVEES